VPNEAEYQRPLIISPLTRLAELEALARDGADEVYCGYIPPAWLDTYSYPDSLNLSCSPRANFPDEEELVQAVKEADRLSVGLALAVNASPYTPDQLEFILQYMNRMYDRGVRRFIVGNLNLIILLKDRGFTGEIHVSSNAGVLNPKAAVFFHELGARRIIVPDQLSKSEVETIARDSDGISIETFVVGNHCRNLEGFCTFGHKKGTDPGSPQNNVNLERQLDMSKILAKLPSFLLRPLLASPVARRLAASQVLPCQLPYRCFRHRDSQPGPSSPAAGTIERQFGLFISMKRGGQCGACAVADFITSGVNALKLDGRDLPLEGKLINLQFLCQVRELACGFQEGSKEFSRQVKQIYADCFGGRCQPGQCYFPDIFHPE